MSWDFVFGFINAIAVAAWLLLAVGPRKALPLSIVLYIGVGLLCLIYTVAFAGLFGGWLDPVRTAPAQPFRYDIAGIRDLFMGDGGIVLGWTHYLAFDLFVGLWIAKDADAKGFNRLLQLPILFATFMAGPIGLLIWLAIREPAARRAAR